MKSGDDECRTYQCPGEGPEAFFCFTAEANQRPNETRIAFWEESRGELERLAGAQNVEGPELVADYSPGYFFEDPSGNKLEVCFRQSRPLEENGGFCET